MSDDLSAFFAKKKDKKKRNVVKMEDVGHILELKVKRQEENDQLQMDAEVRNVDDNEFQMRARVNSNTGGATSGEESEWIDYTDTNQGRLEGLKIKDMGADSGDVAEEDNVDDDDQKVHTESIRTWGQLEKKEEDHQNDDHFATFKAKTAYVIPAQRQAQMRGAQKVDISNNEMFPTLADASKIEKDKKEEAKSGGWLKSGGNQSATSESRPLSSTNRWNISSGPPPSAARERDNAIKAVAAYNAQNSAQSSLIMREKEPDPPKPGKYVPPHFRNRN